MAKTFVVDSEEGHAKTPFLRGIMTSSLHRAGLPFDDAYALASKVRDELDDKSEITTQELREIVLPLISKYGPATVQRYEHAAAMPATILVRHSQGQTSQFSRERHRRVLESERYADFYVDVGLNAFLMTRSDYDDGRPFPGLLPSLSTGNRHVGINLTYLPKIAVEKFMSASISDPSLSGILFVQFKFSVNAQKR